MLKSSGAYRAVRCTEVVRISEGPLRAPCCVRIMNDAQFSAAVAHALCQMGIVLKPEQVQAAYRGRDAFLWLLTGFGKSIGYEIRFESECSTEVEVFSLVSWNDRSSR